MKQAGLFGGEHAKAGAEAAGRAATHAKAADATPSHASTTSKISDAVSAHVDNAIKALNDRHPAVGKFIKGVEYTNSASNEYSEFDRKIRLSNGGMNGDMKAADNWQNSVANKPGFAVSGGVNALVAHEYGHGVDHFIKTNADEATKDEWLQTKKNLEATTGHVSDYAKKSTREWMAERFAAEHLGQLPPVLTPKIDEFVNRVSGASAANRAAGIDPHTSMFGTPLPVGKHAGLFGESSMKPAPTEAAPVDPGKIKGSANALDPKNTAPLPFEAGKEASSPAKTFAHKQRVTLKGTQKNGTMVQAIGGDAGNKYTVEWDGGQGTSTHHPHELTEEAPRTKDAAEVARRAQPPLMKNSTMKTLGDEEDAYGKYETARTEDHNSAMDKLSEMKAEPRSYDSYYGGKMFNIPAKSRKEAQAIADGFAGNPAVRSSGISGRYASVTLHPLESAAEAGRAAANAAATPLAGKAIAEHAATTAESKHAALNDQARAARMKANEVGSSDAHKAADAIYSQRDDALHEAKRTRAVANATDASGIDQHAAFHAKYRGDATGRQAALNAMSPEQAKSLGEHYDLNTPAKSGWGTHVDGHREDLMERAGGKVLGETSPAQSGKLAADAAASGKIAGDAQAVASPKAQPWEKSDLATSPNISSGYLKATKHADGSYRLTYRGGQEFFPGEKFKSAHEARSFFAVQQIKAQQAHARKSA